MYVHSKSNHPSYIIRQIPESINHRISKLSKNANAFNENKELYEAALKHGNYNYKLNYEQTKGTGKSKRNKRKRNIIYYNPPYCKTVATNIGKNFLRLIDKHFHVDHKYAKIFNRKTLKLSYSCMSNIKMRITAHNRNILEKFKTDQQKKKKQNCNCRKKTECPVKGDCLTPNVIYRAVVTSKDEEKSYVGSSGNNFKERYRGHKASFNSKDPKKQNCTGLASYVWKLKKDNMDFEIGWEILCRTKNKFNIRNGCKLCNLEKYFIALQEPEKSLNKRTELKSKCVHYRSMFF